MPNLKDKYYCNQCNRYHYRNKGTLFYEHIESANIGRLKIYKSIPMERARREFLKRSKRARSLDMRKTSQHTKSFPDEEWLKYQNRIDVKGIDDYRLAKANKEKEIQDLFRNIKRFYKDYEVNDSEEALRNQIEYSHGIYDRIRITYLTTAKLFEYSELGKQINKGKNNQINKEVNSNGKRKIC